MVVWQLTIDANDPARPAPVWAQALGYPPAPPAAPDTTRWGHHRGPPRPVLGPGARLPAGAADRTGHDVVGPLPRPARRGRGVRGPAVRSRRAPTPGLVPAGPRGEGGKEPGAPRPVPHRSRRV